MNSNPAIILTGGLGLIGKSTAHFLANKGFHVIFVDIAPQCDFTSENISYLQFDLMQIENYAALMELVKQNTNNLKGVINNAAFNPKVEDNSISVGKFEDLNLLEWRKEVNLNLSAPIFLIQSLLPLFNHTDNTPC